MQVGYPSGLVMLVQKWHSVWVWADLKLLCQKKKKNIKKKIKLVTISMAGKPELLVVFKCGVKGYSCKIY